MLELELLVLLDFDFEVAVCHRYREHLEKEI
jgi:hypothetical protein